MQLSLWGNLVCVIEKQLQCSCENRLQQRVAQTNATEREGERQMGVSCHSTLFSLSPTSLSLPLHPADCPNIVRRWKKECHLYWRTHRVSFLKVSFLKYSILAAAATLKVKTKAPSGHKSPPSVLNSSGTVNYSHNTHTQTHARTYKRPYEHTEMCPYVMWWHDPQLIHSWHRGQTLWCEEGNTCKLSRRQHVCVTSVTSVT